MPSQSSSNKTPSYTPRPYSPLAPPMPQQIQPPSFFTSVIQGFGLGAGSSIAHNMFDSKQDTSPLPQKYTGPCAKEKEVFDKCIEYRQTIEQCERNLKDLRACYEMHPK